MQALLDIPGTMRQDNCAQPCEPAHELDAILLPLTTGTGLQGACCRFEPSLQQVDALLKVGISRPVTLETAACRRQAEHLAGRWCAHTALDKLGVPAQHIPIGGGRAPLWPDGAVGAISHSASFAMALVGRSDGYRGIGLDMEAIQSISRADLLREHVLDSTEITGSQHSGLSFAEWFTVAFSAKESLFKALYPIAKHCFYFLDAHIDALDVVCGYFSMTLKRDLFPHYVEGDSFHGRFALSPAWVVTTLTVQH